MNFQTDVIDRSHTVPVVVDFWAEWCGPCRILGPVIEQLAEEADGTWELVKIDTEAHQDVARQYRIMSIPAVKMFIDGEPVAEFAGALPRAQIEAWLQAHLPDPFRDQLSELRARLGQGHESQVVQELEQVLAQQPDLTEARTLLAALKVAQDPIAAQDSIADFRPGQAGNEDAEAAHALAEMMLMSEDGQPKVTELIETAREAYARYDFSATLQSLIQAIMIHKPYCDEMPRRAALAIFRVLGEEHPLTKQYRPHFSMALY